MRDLQRVGLTSPWLGLLVSASCACMRRHALLDCSSLDLRDQPQGLAQHVCWMDIQPGSLSSTPGLRLPPGRRGDDAAAAQTGGRRGIVRPGLGPQGTPVAVQRADLVPDVRPHQLLRQPQRLWRLPCREDVASELDVPFECMQMDGCTRTPAGAPATEAPTSVAQHQGVPLFGLVVLCSMFCRAGSSFCNARTWPPH